MAGLLEEYGIDVTNVEAPEYGGNPADDIYEFTLGDVYIQEGSKNHPDKSWVIFKYLIGDQGKDYSELFSLPKDPTNPTDQEANRLGYYKQRLVSLGVAPEDVNSVGREDLVGTRGTFELRTTKGKDGKEYQNIRNFKVAGGDGSLPAAPKAKPATAVSNPFA
jgi:hypothetical protein